MRPRGCHPQTGGPRRNAVSERVSDDLLSEKLRSRSIQFISTVADLLDQLTSLLACAELALPLARLSVHEK
jgi:hypothetical protein